MHQHQRTVQHDFCCCCWCFRRLHNNTQTNWQQEMHRSETNATIAHTHTQTYYTQSKSPNPLTLCVFRFVLSHSKQTYKKKKESTRRQKTEKKKKKKNNSKRNVPECKSICPCVFSTQSHKDKRLANIFVSLSSFHHIGIGGSARNIIHHTTTRTDSVLLLLLLLACLPACVRNVCVYVCMSVVLERRPCIVHSAHSLTHTHTHHT